jgi:hypothetical protein
MAVCLGKSIMLSPFPVSDPMQTGQEMACPTAVGGGLQLEPVHVVSFAFAFLCGYVLFVCHRSRLLSTLYILFARRGYGWGRCSCVAVAVAVAVACSCSCSL